MRGLAVAGPGDGIDRVADQYRKWIFDDASHALLVVRKGARMLTSCRDFSSRYGA